MERKPILDNTMTENSNNANMERPEESLNLGVIEIPEELTVSDLTPRRRFEFAGANIAPEAEEYKQYLQQFLETNKDFILNYKKDTYVEGFRSALAIVYLWLDSMYVTGINR